MTEIDKEREKFKRDARSIVGQIKLALISADGWEAKETFYKDAIEDVRKIIGNSTRLTHTLRMDGNPVQAEIDALMTQPDGDVVEHLRELLVGIAERPNLPNPEHGADWKNCQKLSSHDARKALVILGTLSAMPPKRPALSEDLRCSMLLALARYSGGPLKHTHTEIVDCLIPAIEPHLTAAGFGGREK